MGMSLTAHSAGSFAAVRDAATGRIDLAATILAAQEAAYALDAADRTYTQRCAKALHDAWRDPNFSGMKSIALSALARMVLARLGILPDEAHLRDTMSRLRSIISENSDKFLMLKSGSNSNVYLLSRHSDAELDKLLGKR